MKDRPRSKGCALPPPIRKSCAAFSTARGSRATSWPISAKWRSTESHAPRDPKQCLIWIEDDGAGIPAAERSRIFDRGVRLDTDKPGTGLGLAIVRDVAEIYGGSVTLLQSEDLGGLLVELRLPRAD